MDERETSPTRQAWLVLGILMVIYQLSAIDKQMYSLLINPLGQGLGLSDSQLGTIHAVGFSWFYTGGLLLVGWAVDRWSQRAVLFCGILLWSFCATASGLATGYGSLFAARAGLGLGEAVVIPVAYALMASYFPRDRLASAVGIFSVGSNVGGVAALLLGGQLIAWLTTLGPVQWPIFGLLKPWQAAFVLTGVPGLVFALLVFLIPRKAPIAPSADKGEDNREPFWDFVRTHKAFLFGAMMVPALFVTSAYAIIVWSPAFFERKFGLDAAGAGLVVALGVALGGVANVIWGVCADRLARAGRRDALFVLYPKLAIAGLMIAAVTFLSNSLPLAVVGYALTWMTIVACGPLQAAVMFGIPHALRGRLVALYSSAAGLLGLSLGPISVSWITDHVFADKAMVGASMLITMCCSAGVAMLIIACTRQAYIAAVLERETEDQAPVT